jgi:hypothetical protein
MMARLKINSHVAFVWFLVLLVASPPVVFAQEEETEKLFKQEELDQMLAPIALYTDSLLAQLLMASTYPLEVVQAARWLEQNKDLKDEALADALEKKDWDPSVKSLIQFPDVLSMMDENLDWMQKLGDAFLSQEEDVTNTIQNLRKKAKDTEHLKTTKEQVVKVEKEVIIIEPASPKVVYVPVYNPTVVYGVWWWPAYPPFWYYPPYYARPPLYGFAAGVAVGVAWGYAWGHWNWHHHHVNININRNINLNRNINRDRYAQRYGSGDKKWNHDPQHRKGVSYRDRATAQKFNSAASTQAVRSRESFRGRTEKGTSDLTRRRPEQSRRDSQGATKKQEIARGGRERRNAFSSFEHGGKMTRDFSHRGSASRHSAFSGSRGAGFSGRRR